MMTDAGQDVMVAIILKLKSACQIRINLSILGNGRRARRKIRFDWDCALILPDYNLAAA
jgi:hypothetical protein